MRIGQGYDVHRFAEPAADAHVTLCGVRIPHARGIVAHSDGDIPIHALCDALLGALALGDIGRHFPDTDEKWKGADSRTLLRAVAAMLDERGWRAGNVDLTLVAEAPRIASHVPAMRAHLAADLDLSLDAVSVKATTNEKIGFIGREEGIAAFAVALIVRSAAR
ncbi:MAG: 2-C-methyl-D-erythritol 2,4-cyclodiphosphate synthase [Pseudomonadota bacterium]